MARGETMLTTDVQSYLKVRRAMGFALHSEGTLLQSFAAFSEGARSLTSMAKRPWASGTAVAVGVR